MTKPMKEVQFQVEIIATKTKVWATLWNDETFREWAGIIDPGTYMTGELKQGNEVQFISAENGYGVTSLVDKLVENKLLVLKHRADTQDTGSRDRKDEWTGGTETYLLAEIGDTTNLSVTFDVPLDMEEYFNTNYPKALARVKLLAER